MLARVSLVLSAVFLVSVGIAGSFIAFTEVNPPGMPFDTDSLLVLVPSLVAVVIGIIAGAAGLRSRPSRLIIGLMAGLNLLIAAGALLVLVLIPDLARDAGGLGPVAVMVIAGGFTLAQLFGLRRLDA